MKVKEENEKAGLKFNIWKTKIMASSPIITWQIEGEKVEAVTDFLFLGSKITANGECSHEIKRHLLLRRKAMTNLDSVLKSRDLTLPASLVAQLPQCGRPGFNSWVANILWRREKLPIPVFWHRQFHRLYSPWACKQLDMTEWLSLSLCHQRSV